jgi:glycosyltransferase involved in cell wall biosynthesis
VVVLTRADEERYTCELGPGGEVIARARDGLLVDAGDVRGLAEALRGMIEDDRLRRRLGAAAAARAQAFSMDAVGPPWDAIVAQAATSSSSVGRS